MGRWRLPGPLTTVLAVWLITATGGWVFLVAVSVYAYHRAGAGGVGAVAAARLLPAMLAAPFMGQRIDRADRGRVIAFSCVFQAACLGGAALLALNDAPLAPVVVLAALISMAATAPRPALAALMPAFAESPEQLTRATGIWAAVDNGAFLLGGGLGGIAIAATSTGTVLTAAGVTFVVSAVLAARLPRVRATELDEDEDEEPEGFADALAGLRALLAAPMLRAPYAMFAGALLLEGTSDVQLVALSLGKLGMGNGGPGILFAAWGAAGMFGSVVLMLLVRSRGYGLALCAGTFAFSVGLAAAGAGGVAVALVAMVPAGVGFALVESSIVGLVPRLADDALIGRVYALSEILYAGAGGIGALIAPLLIAAFGSAGSLAVVGAGLGVCALLGWRACARVDADQEQATGVRELLHGVDFLAPLPLPRLERLVREARAVSAPAGTDIVTRGEPGDDFFVVDEGTVEIVEHGFFRGRGSGFGEIALLRDVPRTATVRATTDVNLWALGRTAFIGAVTNSTDSERLADELISERLSRPPEFVPLD